MTIQIRLKELMAKKERGEQLSDPDASVTYRYIRDITGISTNTLYKMANNKQKLVSIDVLDRLCEFFSCSPGDILVKTNGKN